MSEPTGIEPGGERPARELLLPPLTAAGLVVALGLFFALQGAFRSPAEHHLRLFAVAVLAATLAAGWVASRPWWLSLGSIALAAAVTATWMLERTLSSRPLRQVSGPLEMLDLPMPWVTAGLLVIAAAGAGGSLAVRRRLTRRRR